MKSRRSGALIVGILVAVWLVFGAQVATAQFTYIEDFSTHQYHDTLTTTAFWDTVNGELSLPWFAPTVIGSYVTAADPEGIAVAGDYAFVAVGGNGLSIIDISAPAVPTFVTSFDTPGDAVRVDIEGDYAFIADGTFGLTIVDISDPTTPTMAASDATVPGLAVDVAVAGNYAYVAFSTIVSPVGLAVFDVSDPNAPAYRNIYLQGEITSVEVAGNYAYVTDSTDGLVVIDISDPLNPSPGGSYAVTAPQDVAVAGNYAFVVEGGINGQLYVIDISDPTSPSLASETSALTLSAPTISLSGNYAYIGDDTGVIVLDISGPTTGAPEIQTLALPSGAVFIAISGTLACVSSGADGVQVVKIADIIGDVTIQTPFEVGGYYTPSAAYDVAVDGDLAFVTDDTGLHVIDITDVVGATLLGSYTEADTGRGVTCDGDLVFVAARGDGLQIIDVSDPTNPQLEGNVSTPGQAFDVKVSGNYAYVAVYDQGVVSVDITDPTNPGVVDTWNPGSPDYCRGLELHGDWLFLAAGTHGIQVLNIMDPTDITQVGSYDIGSTSASDIAVSGDLAYVAYGEDGIRVLDIEDPTSPVEIGSQGVVDAAYGLAVDGDYLVVATLDGYTEYDVSDPTDPTAYSATSFLGVCYNVALSGDNQFLAYGDTGLIIMKGIERFVSAGDDVAQSTNVNETTDMVSQVRLTTTPSTIDYLTWEVSANNGITWQPIQPGAGWVEINNQGNDLRWRSTYLYSNSNFICTQLQLDYVTLFVDADGDGVEDTSDSCPGVDASFFDRDGDGCVDATVDGRHIEFWETGFTYYIHLDGAPGVTDGSDLTAVQQSIDAWSSLIYGDPTAQATYGGTIDWDVAVPGDGNNLVTWADTDYDFGTHVLAVGVATSFTEPTFHNDKWYRPGEIVDADMIFNPQKSFKTDTMGEGIDIESVATHEAGHLYGLSHTALTDATMFFVLPPGNQARSLERDDIMSYLKAYPDPTWLPTTNQITGRVETSGAEGVPGALVFLIDAILPDTLACALTLPDGSFQFVDVPLGTFNLSVYPIDGTSPIGYLQPSYINWAADSMAVTTFVPEYWTNPETADDDPEIATPIVVDGSPLPGHVFVLNEDTTPPTVESVSPAADAVDVRADAAVVVTFSEAVDHATIPANFRLENTTTGSGVGGNAVLTGDGKLLAFTPFDLLDYQTTYLCSLRAGIEDKFGNALGTPYVWQFTIEEEPPLNLSSLVPDKGVVGSIVVFNGAGFDTIPSGNTVRFTDAAGTGTVTATVTDATQNRLVVTVPQGAGTGNVDVTVGPATSDPRTYTVLPSTEVARGYPVGEVDLGVLPRSVTVTPDGSTAYVATASGVSAVGVDPGSGEFLTHTPIDISAGLDELDATPDGKWIFAVSRTDEAVYIIKQSNNTIDDTLFVNSEPLGVVVDPTGNRAYVSTDDGDVQSWDIQEGSATYRQQVGTLTSPDPNVRGKMAVDPAGDVLLVPTGTGKLLAFDLGPDTFLVDVPVVSDPRDVVVDPMGQRAYVTDEKGFVTIVNMAGLFKVQDITTGGSLRGLTVTPAGLCLYTANRELNVLDVVDLNESNSTYRSVSTNISLGINPVDVEISPTGDYTVSLIEAEQKLVVTAVGVGPVLKTLSRRAGPEGTNLVLSGEGFGTDPDSLYVNFTTAWGTTDTVATRATERSLTVTVPNQVVSGPVSVTRERPTGPETSNSIYFEVLGSTPPGGMRLAAEFQPDPPQALVATATMSPLGDQLLIGTDHGVVFLDTDPTSPTYNQQIGFVDFVTREPFDIAITPDGRRALVSTPVNGSVEVLNTNRVDPAYATVIDDVDFAPFVNSTATQVEISLDGEMALVYDDTVGVLHWVDLIEGAPTEYAVLDTTHVAAVSDIAFHPFGTHALMTLGITHRVTSIDVDSTSANFWTRVSTLELPPPPSEYQALSLSFYPKGYRCFVLADSESGINHYCFLLNTSLPDAISYVGDWTHGDTGPTAGQLGYEKIDVSPRGDHTVFHQNGLALYAWDVDMTGFLSGESFGMLEADNRTAHDYTINGSQLYAVTTFWDNIQLYDFQAADTLRKDSGDGQNGIAGQTLPAPLRVQVKNGTGGVAGVAVTFEVTTGGGVFTANNDATQVVTTDANGYAEVTWKLGATIGTQTVAATALGLVDSPAQFTAEAVVDPSTLPLELVDAKPANGTSDIASTTTVVAVFSRAVDPLTVDESSVYLHKTGTSTPVAGKFGVTENGQTVSISPLAELEYDASYTLELTAELKDENGGALQNPTTLSFMTESSPQLALRSISPPSATSEVTVVLAGTGFDSTPENNTVLFNAVEATPLDGSGDNLKVKVPADAETGTVRVDNGIEISDALEFTVLEPASTSSDDVVATVGTSAATKSVTINPDGTMAYTVSPEAGLVIPIDMTSGESLPGIRVGAHPISIDIGPSGSFVYVANYESNTLSIIDVAEGSPNRHEVVATLEVGSHPVDVAVGPDGDRVYVVNLSPDVWNNIDVIDSDDESANHHTVVATVGSGSATKSITINPDGGLLYLGTDTGYVVLKADDYSYSVVSTVGTGSSTKSMTINPDGSLLFILTTEGDVLIVDIVDGSPNEDTVVATVKGGSKAKTMTLNPDGTLLYLIQEEFDIIMVVNVTIYGSVSVLEPDGSVPPLQVEVIVIDSFQAGEDPEAIAFDPTGSGVALVTNSGPQTVTFLNASFAAIEVAEDSVMVPAGSNIPTLDLPDFYIVNTSDNPHTYDYTMSTDGPATLVPGGGIPVSGQNSRRPGHDPFVTAFDANSSSLSGTTPSLAPGDSFLALPAALDVPPIREYTVQYVVYTVALTENSAFETVDSLKITFEPPVPVFVSSFLAKAEETGVELTWEVASDEAIKGFKIYRREGGNGQDEIVSGSELILKDANVYVDRSVRGGRVYEYTLGVVLDSGEEVLSQPVRVTTKAYRLALFQNYPNPFNPNTTISFTLPAKQHVTLTIYNVEGKRVTTLVDKELVEGYQKFTWDSTDSKGHPVSSGVYFYRLQTGKKTLTKKMVLLK
ncbi:MAG: Ig-like domain-containing protein [Candidatus Latescibacterota bacterium]|nr:MAG: Ig-like domain-containing protein [Candidatus Latescibacterota bacterium]